MLFICMHLITLFSTVWVIKVKLNIGSAVTLSVCCSDVFIPSQLLAPFHSPELPKASVFLKTV